MRELHATDAACPDEHWMAQAQRLAERGLTTTDPNPRVGCLIVRDGVVVGQGSHRRAGEPHAEVHALREAGERAQGACVYVSLEPCSHSGRTPPCADALIAAGVSRVVAAMQDPNPQVAGSGLARLRAAGIDTRCGVLAEQAEALNPGFCKRMRCGRPWFRIKSAISLDGRTAMASGESLWISSAQSRADVQHWRARSSAILTGIGTVLADDPSLNVRLDAQTLGVDRVRQPWRIILDSKARLRSDAKLFDSPGKIVQVVANSQRHASPCPGADFVAMSEQGGMIAPLALADWLGEQGMNEILLEAGPTLSGALVAAGLIDEWVIYLAPHLMGDQARGLHRLPGIERMAERLPLSIHDLRQIGPDIRLTLRPKHAH